MLHSTSKNQENFNSTTYFSDKSKYNKSKTSNNTSFSGYLKAAGTFLLAAGSYVLARTSGLITGVATNTATTALQTTDSPIVQTPYSQNPEVVSTSLNNEVIKLNSHSILSNVPDKTVESSFLSETLDKFHELSEAISLDPSAGLATGRKLMGTPSAQFLVNTYTTDSQDLPCIAELNNGDFVIAWQSRFQDGGRNDNLHLNVDYGVYFQRYDSSGNKIGSETRANTYIDNRQADPRIMPLSNGGFVITMLYYNSFSSIEYSNLMPVLQCFDSNGVKVGGEVLLGNVGVSSSALITSAFDGGFWAGCAVGNDFRVQRLDNVGNKIGNPIVLFTNISANESYKNHLEMIKLSDGKFVLLFSGNESTVAGPVDFGIYLKIYDANWNAVSHEIHVNTYTIGAQARPRGAVLANGGFVVTWESQGQDGNVAGIYGQRFDNLGNKLGSEFQVNTYTINNQDEHVLAALTDGGFQVVWKSVQPPSNTGDIFGQRYDANGNRVGSEFLVNTYTANNQRSPSILGFNKGGFIAAWSGEGDEDKNISGIFARIYPNDPPVLVNNVLTVNPLQSVIMTSSHLSATDTEDAATALTYTINNLQNGRFELTNNPGNAITSFTGQQLADGVVRFVSTINSKPSYSVSVSDTSKRPSITNSAATITFNVMPVLSTNSLSISGGQSVIISSAQLGATDTDTPDTGLTFTVSNIQNGRFELMTAPGTPLTSFTQQQIKNGVIRFVSTSPSSAPSYSISVSDGNTSTTAAPATVTLLNVAPVLVNNTLGAITESQTIVLSTDNFSATDSDTTAANLIFTFTNVQNGRFELVSAPGTAITSFTQQQINNRLVQFTSTSSNAPTYSLSVSDGSSSTAVVSGNSSSFTQLPILNNNTLEINQGQSTNLNTTYLSASDASNNATLIFTPVGSENIIFEGAAVTTTASIGNRLRVLATTTTTWSPVANFTQARVQAGEIRARHLGGATAPKYSIQVSKQVINKILSIPPVLAKITFQPAPVLANNALVIVQGGSVTLSQENFNITGSKQPADRIIWSFNNVLNAEFSSGGLKIRNCTQADINARRVVLTQDNTPTAPSYELTVNDGIFKIDGSLPKISFVRNIGSNVNGGINQEIYIPKIMNNGLSINSGERKQLTRDDLSVMSGQDDAQDVILFFEDVKNGRFESNRFPGRAIASCTQKQINDGDIYFVHTSDKDAPSYKISARNKAGIKTVSEACSVRFDDAPRMTKIKFPVKQGDEIILSRDHIDCSSKTLEKEDKEGKGRSKKSEEEIYYDVVKTSKGSFVDTTGKNLVTFSAADISSGKVKFKHDGSLETPGCELSVRNVTSSLKSDKSSLDIDFSDKNGNLAPKLTVNNIRIEPGKTAVLDLDQLRCEDPQKNIRKDAKYWVRNIAGGKFVLTKDADGVFIDKFTQEQVAKGEVMVVPNSANKKNSVSGVALQAETDPFTFTMVVQDNNGLSSAESVVAPSYLSVNQAPLVSGAESVFVRMVQPNIPFSFDLPADTFKDPDGDPLSIVVATPNWMSCNTATNILHCAGTAPSIGITDVVVTAQDPQGGATTAKLSIHSRSPNTDTDGLSTEAKIGVAVGSGVGGALLIGLGVYCGRQKCKQQQAVASTCEVPSNTASPVTMECQVKQAAMDSQVVLAGSEQELQPVRIKRA